MCADVFVTDVERADEMEYVLCPTVYDGAGGECGEGEKRRDQGLYREKYTYREMLGGDLNAWVEVLRCAQEAGVGALRRWGRARVEENTMGSVGERWREDL